MTSGSSRSLIVVKPLRSANSTVMVRRLASVSILWGFGRDAWSASSAAFGVSAGGWASVGNRAGLVRDDGCPQALGASATRVPQFGQYAKFGAKTKPQPGHEFDFFVPHFGQKAKPL